MAKKVGWIKRPQRPHPPQPPPPTPRSLINNGSRTNYMDIMLLSYYEFTFRGPSSLLGINSYLFAKPSYEFFASPSFFYFPHANFLCISLFLSEFCIFKENKAFSTSHARGLVGQCGILPISRESVMKII